MAKFVLLNFSLFFRKNAQDRMPHRWAEPQWIQTLVSQFPRETMSGVSQTSFETYRNREYKTPDRNHLISEWK